MKNGLCNAITPLFTRRDVLRKTSCGFGWLAFSGIASAVNLGGAGGSSTAGAAAPAPLAPRATHFPGKAKRVLFLCMRGGPSHVDTFDYKPQLVTDDGKAGQRPGSKLFGSRMKFSQHGQSGHWISELFPNLARHADELCMIPSMQTDLPAHPQAFIKLHTGTAQFVRPSLGAWTLYGMGSLNQNLPGFVSITPPSGFGGATNYGSAFLPAIYQGTRIGSDNHPIAGAEVANLRPKSAADDQRAEIDMIQALNRGKLAREKHDPEVEGAIESYELAFRMQSEMPAVMDLSRETDATKKLYGIGEKPTDDFARKCLLARRMLEAGVRFVEVTHGNWDHHFNLNSGLRQSCGEVDRPIAALLEDLRRRGMLDDTLVVWTGEFGRTPYAEGQEGRDHNTKAFTLWMAGGGVKPGFTYGKSDEYGYQAVENPLPIVDLHATLLALDHEKLTYRHAGRDFRLTDVKGQVAREIFA
jgi:hypothetical protein